MLYAVNEEWAFGLIVGDINSKYKWDTSSLYGQDGNTTIEHFPLRRRLAVCYAPTFFKSRWSGEIEWIGSTWLSRGGLEIPLHEPRILSTIACRVMETGPYLWIHL